MFARALLVFHSLLVVLALGLVSQVFAQPGPRPDARGPMALPVDPQLLNDLPELKDVVSWKTLGQVKSVVADRKVRPEFAPAVTALDKQQVKLQGYMLPIAAGETHSNFLLTMRPPHCPFCLSLGPEYIVEVKARSPLKHSLAPVVVSGRLEVLRDDPFGLYYRLNDAQLSNAQP
jgi:hypothetical protein